MKKNFLFPAVIALVVLFSSCQKGADNDLPQPTQGLKLKTVTEDVRSNGPLGNSVTTYNFSYDGSDRMTSMVDASNAGNKFVFAYPSSSKYTMDIFGDNIFIIHADYFLNSNSMLDSSFQYNDSDTITEKYIYNPAKQLTKFYEYDYSKLTGSDLWNTTTYTYDGAGDLVKSEDTDDYVYTYEYYTDKLVLMPQMMPFSSGSNQKAHLPKKVTLTESGTETASATYTYTFDSKDRVSTVRQDYSDGDVVIKTYTYFD
ncbi:MAG TPA: hypothetical protein VJU78_00825 [Chitinophagaceae bacterium]|nr:hypothetical protein [Chitinophagaceae bacterium]